MIKIDTIGVWGFEGALEGMRLPYESGANSDSYECDGYDDYRCYVCKYANRDFCRCERPYSFTIGSNDMSLCKRLIQGGSEHRKFLRMIHVQARIRAPRFFAQELDTYKVGTVKNSSSTMHLITKRLLTLDDFSYEEEGIEEIQQVIGILNKLITDYQTYVKRPDVENKKNKLNGIFRRIKGILPESFMQTFMWDGNYETLMTIYHQRINHRLSEWSGKDGFCEWELSLPYMKDFLGIKEAENGSPADNK